MKDASEIFKDLPDGSEFAKSAGQDVPSIDWLGILTFVVNECQKSSGDSVRCIVNEALCDHEAPFHAEWSDDDSKPINIMPNEKSEPS